MMAFASSVRPWRGWILAAVIGLTGCAHHKIQTRSAKPDDEPEAPLPEGKARTVGDVSYMSNAEPIPVSGVGLVVGLEGTGGAPANGTLRAMLESQLAKMGVQHVKEVVASTDNAMVLVSGLIPAGAQKNDPIDIEVVIPEGSRATSLRGGYLKTCLLYSYGNKKDIGTAISGDNYKGADGILLGAPVARAEGPVLVGMGQGEESARVRQGKVWSGGKCRTPRPFMIVLNKPYDHASVAKVVADRINETFHGNYEGALTDIASAKTNNLVYLRVPGQYRYNLPRYLRVVRLVTLQESPANSTYRNRLRQELLDPAHTVTAALRLEALGRDSTDLLKAGLDSTSPLVRFCAAEALAYLGDPACGEPLAQLTKYRALRGYCLTALASLDEAICRVKLRELMAETEPQTRYGAFRALYSLDENESAIKGDLLADAFWVHRVAPDSQALIHVSSNHRAEVVFFGQDQRLVAPFSILAGGFTITAGKDDDRCTISRFCVREAPRRHQCGLGVEEILRMMADMGGTYSEAYELLRQAENTRSLTCPVAWDALPQAAPVEDLAKAGAGQDLEDAKGNADIKAALEELGATPTLYETTTAGTATAAKGTRSP